MTEFDLIVVERYYLRNNSDQQATILLDRTDEETSRVTIFSGGGGTGLLQVSLGSHSSQTERLADRIVSICGSERFDLEAVE